MLMEANRMSPIPQHIVRLSSTNDSIKCSVIMTRLNSLSISETKITFLPPAVRSTREGNVLTRVCPSICLSTGGGQVQLAGWLGGSGPAGGGGGVRSSQGGQVQLAGGVRSSWGGQVQLVGGVSGPSRRGVRSGWQGGCQVQPGGRGQPRYDNRRSYCYAAGSTPLAFTQEDFLVYI